MGKVFNSSSLPGKANFGWLNANNSISYVNCFSTNSMQSGLLRVLNYDVNTPGRGFFPHPHENMKIITLPIPGDIKHLNSNGYEAVAMSNGFGSISRFICILEILMMKYQLHILKIKKIQDLWETETINFKFPKSSRILLFEIPMN